jgi:hypothetical protein
MSNTKERKVAVLTAIIVTVVVLGTLLLQPIVSLALPISGSGASLAQTRTVSTVSSGQWSDPKIWNYGIPTTGDDVMISAGTTVMYDLQSSPVLGSVVVEGSLIFSRSVSTSITFSNMTVDMSGYMEVGTRSDPIPPSVTANLKLAAVTEGSAKVMVMGNLEIHGSPVTPTWTKLAATARQGERTLILSQPVNWKTGDQIVITSTSLNPLESEQNSVASVSGNQITLARPLKYTHDSTATARGEVADLTRNVVVTSLNPQIHATGIMFMHGAKGGISYAEFSHLGGKGILGAYPIHFHHVHDSMVGTVIQGASVWDSHNRFITIHNTYGIIVKDVVGYGSIGHGFFLEDGTERDNILTNNIAILTLPGKLRPDDSRAAGFWIQNPQNDLTGNVAVSSAGSGFDYALPARAPEVIPFNKENLEASLSEQTLPRQLKILGFADNEAHSNRGDGFRLYRLNPIRDGGISWFKNMSMWRNNGVGADITGAQANITSSTFFGNRMGNLRIAANDMTIGYSQFMGELDGVQTATARGRYAASPFGLIVSGNKVTVTNSIFSGHIPRGTLASADIIGSSRGFERISVTIADTQLLSQHTIIFGYPLNGDSYFNVINLNNDPAQSFTLLRYDLLSSNSVSDVALKLPSQCAIDSEYMALKCPLLTTSKNS